MTPNEARADAADLDLFRALQRAETAADDKTLEKSQRVRRANAASCIRAARRPVRDMMHPQTRMETAREAS